MACDASASHLSIKALCCCMGAMAGVNSARVMLPPRDLAMLPNARLGERLCKLYSSACALSRMCAQSRVQ